MKKTLLYAAALLMSATTIAQIPTSGLIAHYPFNGNTNDESANSNNGIINGATLTTDRFGNTNSAYSFDGNSNIKIPISHLDLGTTFTMSIWVNLQDNSNHFPTYVHGLNTSGTAKFITQQFNTVTNKIGHYQAIAGGNPSTTLYSSTVTTNTWYHAVVTTSSAGSKMYLDGNLVDSDIPLVLSITGDTIQLGDGFNGAIDNFVGYMDDIRFYNNALDGAEVNTLFNEGVCFKSVNVTDTLSIYLSQIITSVNSSSQAATTVKVYPNPTAQNLTVEIDNPSNLSGVTLKVLNAQSVEVHNEAVTGSTQSIDVSGWSAGVYFLHVMNGSTTVDIKKIVVNN